jgi:hypothetical protein
MSWGIPYMGSKSDICASIALNFPKAENFYDLFGGGFSMTHYMLKNCSHKFKNFHFNELEKTTVDLIQAAIRGEFNYNTFKPDWISREDFLAKKEQDAYVRILWSFGNSQKNYLFSKEIERYKKSMHFAVVFDVFDELSFAVFGFDKWPENIKTVHQKRIYSRQKIEHFRVTKSLPKILPHFLDEKQLEQLEQLERLQQLQQLERLQQLQQLQQLSFSALDYRDVQIKKDSVVYCDIPYKGTAKYTSVFNHEDFFNWAAAAPFPVFISEYNIDDFRFKLVYSISKSSKLSGKGMTKQFSDIGNEKLFWNGKY